MTTCCQINMSTSQYFDKLCELVFSRGITREHFLKLKERYKKDVKSVRRFDKINCVQDLVLVLKKRACINHDSISELEYIATFIGVPPPIVNSSETPRNELINERIPARTSHSAGLPSTFNRTFSHNGDIFIPTAADPKTRVYDIIAEQIGQQWKHFARRLGVHEGQLDELERRYKSIAERIYQILRYYDNTCDKRQWRTNLLHALQDARRRDLRNEVERILDIHTP